MAELRIVNVDPGSNVPVMGEGMAHKGLPTVPNCPDCDANHWMHSSPDMHTTILRCMQCGADHTLVGPGKVGE